MSTSLEVQTIRDHSGVRDAWEEVHGTKAETKNLDALKAIKVNGVTFASPLMPYVNVEALDQETRQAYGRRIDFILFRGPVDRSGKPLLVPTDTKVVFHENVPGYSYSFSDHFGVETTFNITESNPFNEQTGDIPKAPSAALAKAISDVLYESKTLAQKQLKATAAFVVALLGLVVASTLFPGCTVNPVAILLGAGLGGLALANFLNGYLYGNTERAALTRTLEELEYFEHPETK